MIVLHVYVIRSEALSKALSVLYAKLLVVLGLAFPVTEVIASGVPDSYYQVLHRHPVLRVNQTMWRNYARAILLY